MSYDSRLLRRTMSPLQALPCANGSSSGQWASSEALSRTDLPMRYRTLLSATVMLLTTEAQAAPKPKECPYTNGLTFDLEKIEAELRSARSCDSSFELFSICMAGATSDTILGGIVTEKCEADSAAKLKKPQRGAYDRDQERCERKYRRQEGSEYRGLTALC